MKPRTLKYFTLTAFVALLSACGDRFLDVKPTKIQRVPTTVSDYLALLDNATDNNNPINIRSSHTLGIIGSDEFYITRSRWEAFPLGVPYDYQKNAYTWEREVYKGGEQGILAPTDFETGYRRILIANLVLDGLERLDVTETELEDVNLARGIALFHRANNYYNLAQLYCPVYHTETAHSDLGMPIRLNPDPIIRTPRASVADTYLRAEIDLKESLSLLPARSEILFRPSKAAAYGLLARMHLQMENYIQAGLYADSCLLIQDSLIDFNDLSTTGNYVFPLYGIGNPEVIFVTAAYNASIYSNTYFNADTNLLAMYEPGDLRREIYFYENTSGQTLFYGSYYGNSWFFTGLATDEMYLIRAECAVRNGNIPSARFDLNLLRKHRFRSSDFSPLMNEDPDELLDLIIAERRKELVLRGTRWEDLRRLNKESRYRRGLMRLLGDERFELHENSSRWVWPFPVEAINAGGYIQNER